MHAGNRTLVFLCYNLDFLFFIIDFQDSVAYITNCKRCRHHTLFLVNVKITMCHKFPKEFSVGISLTQMALIDRASF